MSRSKTTSVRTPLMTLVKFVTVVSMRCGWRRSSSPVTNPSRTNCIPGTQGWYVLLITGTVGNDAEANCCTSAHDVDEVANAVSDPTHISPGTTDSANEIARTPK